MTGEETTTYYITGEQRSEGDLRGEIIYEEINRSGKEIGEKRNKRN